MSEEKTSNKTMDSKAERSYSSDKQSSFKPTKPADISRPQNIKVPPPAPKGK